MDKKEHGYIIETMFDIRGKIEGISTSPSVKEVNEWMNKWGYNKTLIGKSVQFRDISLFSMSNPNSSTDLNDNNNIQNYTSSLHPPINILFLSLVHGNEPMGLLSVLIGAKTLSLLFQDIQFSSDFPPIDLYFLPIVNVDAYTLNLEIDQGGCQRTNLQPVCSLPTLQSSCEHGVYGNGVDLNRNFPQDWKIGKSCTTKYSGPEPFSEPETRAIQKVVEEYNITHAMSFHSLSGNFRGKPLLIHPYVSDRSMDQMIDKDRDQFRSWGKLLSDNGRFLTGNAEETIGYTANGATVDWMYAHKNITAFVVETTPSCPQRWCTGKVVIKDAYMYATLMQRFVYLITKGNIDNVREYRDDTHILLPIVLIFMFVWLIRRKRYNISYSIIGNASLVRVYFHKMLTNFHEIKNKS